MDLKVVGNSWTNPEDVQDLIKKLTEQSDSLGLRSLVVVGELRDGRVWTGSTRTNDRYKLAGTLMQMAMNLLGCRSK